MGLQPEGACRRCWFDSDLRPPCGRIATAVGLAMVTATWWDRELVDDLRPNIRMAELM
jgi:hypothetical protein